MSSLDLAPTPRGFSLVELMAVLAVLALTTGLVGWGVTRGAPVAAGPGLWDALAAVDARARGRAEATGEPLLLRVDLDAQRVGWRGLDEEASSPALRVAPPRGWRLTGCWTDGDGWVERGVAELPLNVFGASPTFGLRLAADRDGAEEMAWVVGETGQWVPRPGPGLRPANGGPDDGSASRR